MCQHAQVTYACRHVRYCVVAWCSIIQHRLRKQRSQYLGTMYTDSHGKVCPLEIRRYEEYSFNCGMLKFEGLHDNYWDDDTGSCRDINSLSRRKPLPRWTTSGNPWHADQQVHTGGRGSGVAGYSSMEKPLYADRKGQDGEFIPGSWTSPMWSLGRYVEFRGFGDTRRTVGFGRHGVDHG